MRRQKSWQVSAKVWDFLWKLRLVAIGGEEDGVVGMGECADPKECKMIADLGVDMLAAGIGNIHGKYPENWPGLRFDRIRRYPETDRRNASGTARRHRNSCRHDPQSY